MAQWVIQAAPKSHCRQCGGPIDLLTPELRMGGLPRVPMFYICWACKQVSEVGVGPVQREEGGV